MTQAKKICRLGRGRSIGSRCDKFQRAPASTLNARAYACHSSLGHLTALKVDSPLKLEGPTRYRGCVRTQTDQDQSTQYRTASVATGCRHSTPALLSVSAQLH